MGLRECVHVLSRLHRTNVMSLKRSFSSNVVEAEKTTLLKQLRERSGAPITEVKAALAEAGWDLETAFQDLRKRGLAAASKKASRSATEGLIGIAQNGPRSAAMVEINCETDFVARNEQFQALVSEVASAAVGDERCRGQEDLDVNNVLAKAKVDGQGSVDEVIGGVAALVRENIQLRRASRLCFPSGVVASYLHTSPRPGLGRIGALVGLESSQGALEGEALTAAMHIGSKIAMHIVALKPIALDAAGIPDDILAGERAVIQEQASSQGKPPNIVEKMVAGRLKKFYEENCLLEQRFVLDESKPVRAVLSSVLPGLRVASFLRMECGEGLKKAAGDLASDVAALQQVSI